MKFLSPRRYVFSLLLTAGFLLSAVSAVPQQQRKTPGDPVVLPINKECPKPFKPFASTINASTPYVDNKDFTAGQLALPRAWLNDPSLNKAFLFTFQVGVPGERCCEITGATLTVKLHANQASQDVNSSDSCNDGISLMHNGSAVAGYSEYVYKPPFCPPAISKGQTVVKTWQLTGAALSNLIADHSLSVYVQDDTMVESASLEIWGCCLKGPRINDATEKR